MSGRSGRGLLADRVHQLAFERLVEIMGEAAARVPEFAREDIPIPWKHIVGLRNRLTHAYDATDPTTLVEIIEVHVPRPCKELDGALVAKG